MKRKLQRLSTKDLRLLFDYGFNVQYLASEVLDLLSERKQRSFIIDKLLREYTDRKIQTFLDDWNL